MTGSLFLLLARLQNFFSLPLMKTPNKLVFVTKGSFILATFVGDNAIAMGGATEMGSFLLAEVSL